MQRSGFAVVIPMYNEESGVEDCIRKVSDVLSNIEMRHALIVVEDGGSDRTWDIIMSLNQSYPDLIAIKHDKNHGYGGALRTGTRRAIAEGYEYVLYMDSDLTNNPVDIPKFFEKMKDGVDVIKATRYSHGGGVDGVPFVRVILSRLGNSIAGFLFQLPLRDCTNGYRAIKTEILEKMNLKENNFSIIMEELYYSRYLAKSFDCVPVVLTDRSIDQRPTSFNYSPSLLWGYLKYPLRSFFCGAPAKKMEQNKK